MADPVLRLKTADIMTQKVVTVDCSWTLQQVLHCLLDNNVSNAPVVNAALGQDRLIGFISEKDCLAALANPLFYSNDQQSVYDLVRIHPICVKPETSLTLLASIFVQHGFRHLPVVDSNYTLIGIVSRSNILKQLDTYYDREVQKQEKMRTPLFFEDTINSPFIVG